MRGKYLLNPVTMLSLIGIMLLAGSGVAYGQSAEGKMDFYEWTAPSIENQLTEDKTQVPEGKGAVFVPAMSKGADEPQVLVLADKEKVATGHPGKRIIVDPGRYTLALGSGSVEQMVNISVEIAAGKTEIIPVRWGGLKIEVVDENNIPHRGTYEIIRSESREVLGIGYGADTLQGEPLSTWLLSPGLYRIVRSGETYRARRDFATVYVRKNGLAHFKLVTDPDTGDFRGGGIVAPEEMGIVQKGKDRSHWTKRMTLGLAASMNNTSNVVGVANQESYEGTGFFDTYVTYDNGPHFGSGILEIEEGFLSLDPDDGQRLPTQVTQDRLRTDVIYIHFLNEHVGPYVRGGLTTNIFTAETLNTDEKTKKVTYNRLDGSSNVVTVPTNDDYRTADGFGSLRFREGVGANVRLLRNRYGVLNWRAGFGFRQNRYNDVFVEDDAVVDDPATDEIEIGLREVDDYNQEGIETVLSGNIRLTRYISYIPELEVFWDFDDMGDPAVDWRNTFSLRLTRYVSLDYIIDLIRHPQVLDETQTKQSLLLRGSFDIF